MADHQLVKTIGILCKYYSGLDPIRVLKERDWYDIALLTGMMNASIKSETVAREKAEAAARRKGKSKVPHRSGRPIRPRSPSRG
jgi:hypothetical protein